MAAFVQASALKRFVGQSNSADAAVVLNGVASGNLLAHIVGAYRYSTASGALIDNTASTIGGSPANTWSTGGAVEWTTAGGHRGACYVFVAPNVSNGNTTATLNCTHETNDTHITHCLAEFSGMATASPVDVTASDSVTAPETTAAVTTSTTTQANTITLYVASSKYWWHFNNGTAPSGFTKIAESDDNTSNGVTFTAGYRINGAAGAQTVSMAVPDSSDGGVLLVVALKATAAGGLVLEFDFQNGTPPDDVDGITNITAWIWTADPSLVTATKVEGVDAEASGNQIRIPMPAGLTLSLGQQVRADFQSADGGASSAQMVGTVVAA